MLRILLLVTVVYASPPMCHCPNGGVGMSCPSPIQLNCPQTQCPPNPPCNPFPTLPTLPPHNMQGISQFTFPTLPPLGGSPFQQSPTTPIPLPVAPPTNGQESLLPISQQQQQQQQFPQQPQQQQQQFQQQYQPQQQQQQTPQQVQPQPQYQPPPPPQVVVQPSNNYVEVPPLPPVDATTRATTLASELYVEADSPEAVAAEPIDNKYSVYENEPNNGFRQPVRRALASNTKPEVFTDKCNDERLKKIIEENVDSNPSTSKRKIQKAATEEIGGLFDVVCSSHDFSYLANTQLFCEAGNDDVTCFAFLHSLIQ